MEDMIITIGRQFGSGGRDLGKKVAEQLGLEYYDKELLAVAAKDSGLSTKFLDQYDEKPTNSFLYSLVMGQPNMFFGADPNTSVEQIASNAQRDAVLKVAETNHCVIVGRCADYILREKKHLIRVFVTADKEDRIARVAKRDQLSQKDAEEKVKRMDKARRSHYNYNTDGHWGEAENYDLCINLSKIDLDLAAQLIIDCAQKKVVQ